MKTIYKGSGATVTLYWKIMRGENKVTEDLSNLKSRVFLIGSCNTYSMDPDVVTDEEFGNKVLKVEVDASMLRTGVYDVKAMWEKNDGRNIMKSARTGVFAITDNSEEVDEIKSEEVIRIASYVESIGRDGLSAYEIAVIRGLNNGLSENDWVGDEAERIKAEQERDSAEITRNEEEIKRKNAEGDRTTRFNTFMEANIQEFDEAQENRAVEFAAAQSGREAAFTDKIQDFEARFNAAEANRNDGEATRNTNYEAAEKERDNDYATAEANRNKKYNQAEEERDSAIQGKLDDIEGRFTTAENARKSLFNENERTRQQNEVHRINAEGNRQKTFEDNEADREQTFQNNEAERGRNEQIRDDNERIRQQAEQARIDTFDENERGRIATFNANEAARIAAENERKQNEAQREANEAIRQESYKDKLPVSAVVQETGDSENLVMSQKAVSGKLTELESAVNGAVVESEVASAETIADQYMVKETGKLSTYAGGNIALVKFPIIKDGSYKVSIAKTTNAAGYILGYAETISALEVTPIVDKIGDRQSYEYSFVADKDGYLFVGISADSEYTILSKLSKGKGLSEKVEEVDAKSNKNATDIILLDEQINGEMVDVKVASIETIADRYIAKETGRINTYTDTNLAIVKFPISKGDSYKIAIAKTTNAAGYVLCYAEILDSLQTTPIVDKIGDRQSYEHSFIAEADGYLFVGISADSEYTTLTKEERSDCIVKDIEEIKKGVGRDWSNKKWVVIGDSLSSLNSTTTKRYIDYIVEKTGIQVEVLAVGGSSWGQPQNNNNAFFQQAERVSADADIVTLFGSFNSWYKKDGDVITDGPTSMGEVNSEDVTTRYGCINTAFKNIYANAPLAKVGVIFPTPWKTANPYNVTETATSLISTLEVATKRWGIPYLDLFHESGMRPWDEEYRLLVYSKDSGGIDGNPNGVHPNELGHEIIATHVLEFMKTLLF